MLNAMTLLAWIALQTPTLPHIPHESDLAGRRSGTGVDADRDYQARAVGGVMGRARGAATWVSQRLRRLHVTPARLSLALGILGILYTAGKNREKVRWFMLTIMAYVLAAVGLAALIFDWPALR